MLREFHNVNSGYKEAIEQSILNRYGEQELGIIKQGAIMLRHPANPANEYMQLLAAERRGRDHEWNKLALAWHRLRWAVKISRSETAMKGLARAGPSRAPAEPRSSREADPYLQQPLPPLRRGGGASSPASSAGSPLASVVGSPPITQSWTRTSHDSDLHRSPSTAATPSGLPPVASPMDTPLRRDDAVLRLQRGPQHLRQRAPARLLCQCHCCGGPARGGRRSWQARWRAPARPRRQCGCCGGPAC